MTAFALPALAESGLARYMDQIRRFPMLGEEEEYMLAKAVSERQDIAAAHRLVTSHLRLVVKIAMGYRGYGLPVTDLIAEGNIGLMQAVKKFDPERGFRLSTYAMWWIKAAIHEYVLRSWSLVKMGTSAAQKKLFFNLRRLKNRITGAENRNLLPKEVAQVARELDVPEQDVVDMDARLGTTDPSLNRTVSEDGSAEWVDLLEDNSENQETLLGDLQDQTRRKHLLASALETLNERERHIVESRHLREIPVTLEELSQTYGVSRERIRQIEARALEKLQEEVLEDPR